MAIYHVVSRVEDPADYRWGTYGEAVGGGRGASKARKGVRGKQVVTRRGMKKEKEEKALERLREGSAKDLKVPKVIRCRVGYFTGQAVTGSKSFVDEIFTRARESALDRSEKTESADRVAPSQT